MGLDGSWGVGKTFWWKNKSKSHHSAVYVSTFRIRSVHELEAKLAAELIATKFSPSENTLQRFFRESFGYSKNFLLGYLESKSGGRAPEGLLEKLVFREFFSGNVRVVCLDDIERTSIPLRELFGFVDYLREEWGINVLLIFNSKHIRPENERDFHEYREKALDREFQFRQQVSESVDVAMKGLEVLTDTFNSVCAKHQVGNIRIIRRAKYLADELRLLDEDSEFAGSGTKYIPQIVTQVCETILVSCLIKYEGRYSPITLSDLQVSNFQFRNDNDNPELADAKAALQVQWGYLDDVDRLLVSFVDNNLIDADMLASGIERTSGEIVTRTQEAELTQVFSEHYHKNYSDTLVPFVDGVLGHAEKYEDKKWSINHLNNVVSVLYKLGLHQDADRILTNQVHNKYTSGELTRWREGSFPDLACEQLATALDEKASEYADNRSLRELLEQIAEDQGFNLRDLPRLTEFTDEEWVEYLTSDNAGPQKAVQYILKTNLDDPNFRSIKETTQRVLLSLMEKSDFNRIRIERILPPQE